MLSGSIARPVTNGQFEAFVRATGYVTFAEKPPDPRDYPGALPEMLYAGSLVFTPPPRVANLRDWGQWWSFMKAADWRHPYGPGSDLSGLDDHPVVHVAFADTQAYAQWVGKDVPTEAEWEFAARGGLEDAEFAWGDELTPDGKQMANTWQGNFPVENLEADGFARTSPVTAFPANGYGAHDMIGNVWEWTTDWFTAAHQADAAKACCIPKNPRGGAEHGSYDAQHADQDSSQGHQGRLASVRAELLPALPPCGAARRADRHVDEPPRLSLSREA